tara:strand:- start:1897 stop:3888 length:1992 start_codon:yes stop_codon:yes gene_type:complete
MPSENYDFISGDSPDEIEKYFQLLTKIPQAFKGIKAGVKNLAGKVGVKGGGSVTEAAGAAKEAAGAAEGMASAAEAVESAAPKPSLPKASDGTDSVPLPESPAAEPAAEMPEPEEPSGAGGNKTDYKKIGMQLAGQMQAQNAQRKQAQEQRAMEMARRGASVQTGEPMNLAWRLLKNIDEVQLCPSCQGVGFGCRYCKGTGLADNERFHPEDTTNEYPGYDEDWPYPTDKKIGQTVPDAQKTDDGKPITFFHNTEDWLASRPEPIKMRTNSQDQPSFMYMPFAGASKEMKNPAAKIFRRSEPMNLVWRLLKEEDDEVPDPRKFKMPQEDYVEALRERAKRIKGRQADPNMAENTENVPMGLKEKVPFTQPPGGGPIQLPTKLTPPNASQGIQRRVHPFTREGTFEGLPLDTPDADPKKYFTRSEAMDIAYQLLKFEELTDMHAPAPRNFNEYFGIKDSWVSLPKEGMDARPQLYDEVANAMNIAYKPVGGHDKYSDGNDLKNESKHARYDMIDNDQDPYVDAARVFSQQEQGFKASITAHDGQPAAKRAAVDHMMEHMQIPGHYIEVSGAWPRIFDKQGMQPITDYDHIRELVNRPLRETETAPGTYTRKIGENEREKQIFGSPMRDGATWADDFMQQATEASRNNSALVLNDYNFPKSVGVM